MRKVDNQYRESFIEGALPLNYVSGMYLRFEKYSDNESTRYKFYLLEKDRLLATQYLKADTVIDAFTQLLIEIKTDSPFRQSILRMWDLYLEEVPLVKNYFQ